MSTPKQWIIVGLGNPGKKYEVTRHNLGFLVLKNFALKHRWHFKEERALHTYAARGNVDGVAVHLLMPTTYMNESGVAVRRYLDYYKLAPEHIVVVVDDVAIPFQQMRLKPSGSAGGHNGLKSIESHLGTRDYIRLRMGVGDNRCHTESLESLADYVLSGFTTEELNHLEKFVSQGAEVLEQIINNPLTRVMNRVNEKEKEKVKENPRESGQEKTT